MLVRPLKLTTYYLKAMKEQIKEILKKFAGDNIAISEKDFDELSVEISEELSLAPSVTDDDIKRRAEWYSTVNYSDLSVRIGYEEGAKWMRDNHLPSKGYETWMHKEVAYIVDDEKGVHYQLFRVVKETETTVWLSNENYSSVVAYKHDVYLKNQTPQKSDELPSKGDDYTKSLEDCGNKILDSVDKNETPVRAIMGLRILLNRPYQKQALKTKGGEGE